MKKTIHLAVGACLALSVVGCGSSSSGKASDGTPPSSAAAPTGAAQAPAAVCDFKVTWGALGAQLTKAEADLRDAALWGDTASAFDSVTAPEAVKDAWGPLANDVAAITQAVQTGDDDQIQSAVTSRLPEEKRLHQNLTALFGQLCP